MYLKHDACNWVKWTFYATSFFPTKFHKVFAKPRAFFLHFLRETKQYEKSGLPHTFLSQAEDKCVILTSRLSFITWDIVMAFKSNLIHPNINWQSKIWPFFTQPAKKVSLAGWSTQTGANTFICSMVCTNTLFAACSAHLPVLKNPSPARHHCYLYYNICYLYWGMRSTKNTT